MTQWWNELDTILKVLYCIAIPSSIILIIQTILSLIGFGDGGSGVDVSDTSGLDMGDVDIDTDIGDSDINIGDGSNPADFSTMRLFTLQGIIAFFTVFSWSAIATIASGTPEYIGIIVGFVLGIITMIAVAKLVQLSSKLNENGTLNIKNAIGETATVYLPIPANKSGEGKITASVQGRFTELNAVTSGHELKTNAKVRVTDVIGDVVVVEEDN